MTVEGQTNWSPEQLEEWARPALEYPELVEIARTVTSNNQAKNEALAWITKIHEPLGQACRWLHILRAKYPERFEKLVSQTERKLRKEEAMERFAISVPASISAVINSHGLKELEFNPEKDIRGNGISIESNIYEFVLKLLEEITGIKYAGVKLQPADRESRASVSMLYYENLLMGMFIQILEEKYGLKVKICKNCEFYKKEQNTLGEIEGECRKAISLQKPFAPRGFMTIPTGYCERWTPSERKKKF